MKKNILGILILTAGILITGVINSPVDAQTISYPITELGNCADKAACKVYCDNQTNIDTCLSFAEKNNMMSKEEIKVAKNFKNKGMTGPGGCKGKDECKIYCNGPDHMDECVTFAEKNGLMSSEQLDEAKKVKAAMSKGIKPPACGGKEACDSYCSSSEHVEECLTFGEAAGIIRKEDAEKIRNRKDPEGQQGQGPAGQGDGKGPEGQGPGNQGPGSQGGPGGGNGGDGPKGQGQGPAGQGGGKGPGGQGGPGGGGNGKGEKGKGGPGQGGGKGPGGQGPGNQGPGGQGQGPGGGNGGGQGNGGSGGGQGQGGGNGGGGGGNGGGGKP